MQKPLDLSGWGVYGGALQVGKPLIGAGKIMGPKKKVVADAKRIDELLAEMAQQIVQSTRPGELMVVGIRNKGETLGRRLAEKLSERTGAEVPVGVLDITLYRDDLSEIAHNPVVKGTDLITSVDDKRVVLVDDVFFTGRTARAAMDQIIDFGRPACIELAVLVERPGRELPIRPDYVGLYEEVPEGLIVDVQLVDAGDSADEVVVIEQSSE